MNVLHKSQGGEAHVMKLNEEIVEKIIPKYIFLQVSSLDRFLHMQARIRRTSLPPALPDLHLWQRLQESLRLP